MCSTILCIGSTGRQDKIRIIKLKSPSFATQSFLNPNQFQKIVSIIVWFWIVALGLWGGCSSAWSSWRPRYSHEWSKVIMNCQLWCVMEHRSSNDSFEVFESAWRCRTPSKDAWRIDALEQLECSWTEPVLEEKIPSFSSASKITLSGMVRRRSSAGVARNREQLLAETFIMFALDHLGWKLWIARNKPINQCSMLLYVRAQSCFGFVLVTNPCSCSQTDIIGSSVLEQPFHRFVVAMFNPAVIPKSNS
jgi:hypothetical protein